MEFWKNEISEKMESRMRILGISEKRKIEKKKGKNGNFGKNGILEK